MTKYVVYSTNNYLAHHGILGMRWGVRRYQPYSTTGKRKSGKGGKEIGEAAKAKMRAEKAMRRKEAAKKALKTAGNIALKSALTGATVAAKVVFSSAITSATLIGIAAAGYQTITSPEVKMLLDSIGVKAGTWIADRYLRVGASYANQNLDEILRQGTYYLNSL